MVNASCPKKPLPLSRASAHWEDEQTLEVGEEGEERA